MKKFKLILWIVAFLFLLLSIPIFLMDGNYDMAKLFGGIFAALAVVAIVILRGQNLRSRSKKKRVQLSEENKSWMNEHIAIYSQLSRKDAVIFEDRIRLFMANISIRWENKNADVEDRIYVAASAIMAFWGLPYFDYGKLENVILSSDGPKGEWSPKQLKLNFSTLVNSFKQEMEEKTSHFPEYIDFLAVDSTADFSSLHFHQELWTIIVEKIKSEQDNGNDTFFKVLEEFQKNHPKEFQERNPSLASIFLK